MRPARVERARLPKSNRIVPLPCQDRARQRACGARLDARLDEKDGPQPARLDDDEFPEAVPMSETGTTQLLNRCLHRLQAGAELGREELFQHACERLRRLTRKILRDYSRLQRWQETDDVFQSAMVRLHQNLQKHTPASAQEFFQWSAKEIRRTLIDLSRHHFGPEGSAANYATPLRVPQGENTPPPHREPAGAPGDAGSLGDWTELHEQIEALPAQEKLAFDLLWYHELTQEEAAEVLGVDRRTVIRWWQSAKRLLMERMKGNMPGL